MTRDCELQPGCVAVVAAMLPELRPILERFSLRAFAHGSDRFYRGRAASRELIAVVTSMGTAAAADVTTRLLETNEVNHVVVVGIAGAIDAGLSIGELLNPEEVFSEATGALRPTPHSDAKPRGRLLTSDTLLNTAASCEQWYAEGFVAVDMETAAIGAVAESRGIPWTVFRAISDRAGDPDVDRGIVELVDPDGRARPAAVARYVLGNPWRIPKLARLGRGMRKAVATSTGAAMRALEAGG